MAEGAWAAKLALEVRLAEDLVHRAFAALLEHPVQFAVDTAERARAFLHQRRSDADRLGACEMRDIRVASGVDSAHRHDVVRAAAKPPERMRLRERARGALDPARGDIDLKVLGQVVGAYRYAD